MTKRPLYTFAVVADTHINEAEDKSASPYPTNLLNNSRARHVFREIAAIDPPPKFVIHLGDIVHPVPSLPVYDQAVSHFRDMIADMPSPVHVLPGNHDIGDKRIDWMPADQICDKYIDRYRLAFGRDFHSFDDNGVRFILINSVLMNSGLDDEQRQREWLEAQIDSADEQRVFIFMHYPPFIYARDEHGSYDNIDEPARAWLLAQLEKPGVEAIFCGHVHNFWYDRIGTADYYMLPSTAFMRHDYSEFYRVGPIEEFGRGDVTKFGYFLVDVHEDGHVAHPVRTMGARSAIDADGVSDPLRPNRLLAHPKTSSFHRAGVELRHPWAETQRIPNLGGTEEFGRKWARNDYPLLALWEMGARLAKTTDQDLADDEIRQRMSLAAGTGMRFVITSMGVPRPKLPALAAGAGVDAFEANMTLANFEDAYDALRTTRESSDAKLFFSMIRSYDPSQFDGKQFIHVIKTGFTVDELDAQAEKLSRARSQGVIDGVTVRVEAPESLPRAMGLIESFVDKSNCEVLVSIKLGGPTSAQARNDDAQTAALAAQAMVLSRAGERVMWIFDTFMDVDRGFYPRHAFIDRRFDPHAAAHVFTTLNALFPDDHAFRVLPAQSAIGDALELTAFDSGGERHVLACGAPAAVQGWLATHPDGAHIYDLLTDQSTTPVEWRRTLAAHAQASRAIILARF